MAEQFANNATSIITLAMLSTDPTMTVQNAVPFPVVGNFRLLVDNEIMLCTSVAANVFTVTRAQEGTIASAHDNYSAVILPLTAASIQNIIPTTDAETITARDSSIFGLFASLDARLENIEGLITGSIPIWSFNFTHNYNSQYVALGVL